MGVYKEVAHIMGALGMPESAAYDFRHYRGKRGIMVADIQTFLHAVALKLGVIIYTGATARDLTSEALQRGSVKRQRATGAVAAGSGSAVGVTRWHYDSVMQVRSGVSVRFDTVLEATGGRSGLRDLLIGAENVVSMRTIARDAALRDPSLNSYFDNPEDHCAVIIESDYGCPPDVRARFASALLDSEDAIPDELPGLVSNVDATIIVRPLEEVPRPAGMGARIGDHELDIPRDWVIVRCPRSDQTLTRCQIEGPLPQSFEFGGKRVPTGDHLDGLNPVSLLLRILYAIGIPCSMPSTARGSSSSTRSRTRAVTRATRPSSGHFEVSVSAEHSPSGAAAFPARTESTTGSSGRPCRTPGTGSESGSTTRLPALSGSHSVSTSPPRRATPRPCGSKR